MDVVQCGEWLKRHAPIDAVIASSLPRLAAFLSDRDMRIPFYKKNGTLDVLPYDYILQMGLLNGIPQFREGEEERLSRAIEEEKTRDRLTPVYHSGKAVVYHVERI